MRGTTTEPQFIAAVTDVAKVSIAQQFSCCAVDVSGTIDAGSLSLKGIIIGVNMPTLLTENVDGGIRLTDNEITEAGIYRCNSAAMKLVQLVPSSDFEGDVTVTFSVTEAGAPTPLEA